MRAARPELAELEGELAAVERRLADPALASDLDAIGRALAHQERLLARWHEQGGDRAESEGRTLLDDLGVPDEALAVPTSELSGGQRKLVQLAACLARRPQVLMLDEPEAHLDMHRRDQLERIVDDFDGAVLMVSHDRHLLDACVGSIAELDSGRIRIWPGGYSAYAVARQLELEKQQQQYVTQQKEIARLEDAVRRFRHWAHITVNERAAKQARVKQMQIDKMEKVDRPVLERRKMALALRSGVRGGQRVIALEGVDVAFDPRRSGAARRRARDRPRRARRRRRPQRRRQDRAAAHARRHAGARPAGSAGSARASRSATCRRPPPGCRRRRT